MQDNQKIIQPKLAKIIESEGIDEKQADSVAFHLTDWLNDLENFYKLISDLESYSTEEANKIVSNFLIHVPEHVVAAKKLYLDESVEDLFELGVLKKG